MKKIGELLSKITTKEKKEVALDEKTLLFIASRVILGEFGEVGRENISPIKIINDMLILKSPSSLWSSEAWLRRDELVKKINQEAGSDLIKRIKV